MGVEQRYNLTVVVLESENWPAPTISLPPGPHTFLGGGTHWYPALGLAGLLGLESSQELQVLDPFL